MILLHNQNRSDPQKQENYQRFTMSTKDNSSMENNHSQTESATIRRTETQTSILLEPKYDTSNTINKGTTQSEPELEHQEAEPNQEPSKLLFFNYHEYMVKNYTLLETGISDIYEQSLVVTHFPNYTNNINSASLKNTRIVRIPRVFNVKGIIYPEFSVVLPGQESAAIQDDSEIDSSSNSSTSKRFVPKGIHEGELFGFTSVSPLSNHFEESEFKQLMENINLQIRRCYVSYHFWNIVEFLLDMMTFWLLSKFFKFQSKRLLDEFEVYISQVNNEILNSKGIRIISPRRTAYLSLLTLFGTNIYEIDFEVPRPTL